ncbi:hypothetical protein INR49_017963, partial [Caranx melampygus]
KLPSTTEARRPALLGSKKMKTVKAQISCPPPLRPEDRTAWFKEDEDSEGSNVSVIVVKMFF